MGEDDVTGQTVVAQRTSVLTTNGGPKRRLDWFPIFLALVVTTGYLYVLYLLFTVEIPKGNESVIMIMIGTLTGAWMMVLGYFYQSTAHSAKKTDLLAKSGPVDPA